MKILEEKRLNIFLDKLGKQAQLFDVRESILPPKRYFFPSREITFTFDKKSKSLSSQKAPKDFILFGISLKDLEAITYLDEIMQKPARDDFYFNKRDKSILIGLTGKEFNVAPGGDIILRKLKNDEYEVVVVTKKGEKFLKRLDFPFTCLPAGKEEKDRVEYKISKSKTMVELHGLLSDPELLHDAVKWSWQGYPEIWDKLAGECLNCGICTYVCPLCHCFSVEDEMDLSGDECRRCRKWDACTLPEFAKVAGGIGRPGHSFHKGVKERYYNWFYHKFVRGYLEFGKSQCVTCGRCKKYCPARIDIEEVLLEIMNRFKKIKN
ncbi:MAG: 4Fe-4S dicluster domain-containing protein [Parcubacteria group bacterium]|nr:4Fe-4S dicluster domain-containing protein [Parcubacteria group bacterium]MCR4342948.1 4Fe-4S dicluster domain-containing protein [Patescibacteria group bacterium]